MHMSTRSLPDLRAWSRLIPVNTKNLRYSPATILLNSLLKCKRGEREWDRPDWGHGKMQRVGWIPVGWEI